MCTRRDLDPSTPVSALQDAPRARFEVAGELQFLGLLYFRNQMRPDTPAAIRELRHDGQIECKIVTGDNCFTAVHIARQCGLVPGTEVLLGEHCSKRGGVVWRSVRESGVTGIKEGEVREKILGTSWSSSMTGDSEDEDDSTAPMLVKKSGAASSGAGRALVGTRKFGRAGEQADKNRHKNLSRGPPVALTQGAYHTLLRSDPAFLDEMWDSIIIFGRMTPTGKVEVVEHCQTQRSAEHSKKPSGEDNGTIVGMCGDGGNDCGALRAADVGLALSDSDASIVSPFSSNQHSVFACVDVIKEGRSCLANSTACFKFFLVYVGAGTG